MESQKRWFRAWVVALGECAFWAKREDVETCIEARIEVANMTQIILGPKGVGFRKLSEKIAISATHIVAVTEVPEVLVKDLVRVWDGVEGNGNIAVPDWETKKRLGLG